MFKIEDLYMKYKHDLFNYLMSLTHNHTLSEDLLSETFVKAIKSLPNFKAKSSIKTWLFGIARNLWLQHLRKNNKDLEYQDMIGIYVTESLEENYISQQAANRVDELLKTKDQRTQDIVFMRIDGLSHSEIAEKLGISENASRVIDFRTKKWLKEMLVKEGI